MRSFEMDEQMSIKEELRQNKLIHLSQTIIWKTSQLSSFDEWNFTESVDNKIRNVGCTYAVQTEPNIRG